MLGFQEKSEKQRFIRFVHKANRQVCFSLNNIICEKKKARLVALCLSVCLSVRLPACLPTCQHACLLVYLSICRSPAYLTVCLHIPQFGDSERRILATGGWRHKKSHLLLVHKQVVSSGGRKRDQALLAKCERLLTYKPTNYHHHHHHSYGV